MDYQKFLYGPIQQKKWPERVRSGEYEVLCEPKNLKEAMMVSGDNVPEKSGRMTKNIQHVWEGRALALSTRLNSGRKTGAGSQFKMRVRWEIWGMGSKWAILLKIKQDNISKEIRRVPGSFKGLDKWVKWLTVVFLMPSSKITGRSKPPTLNKALYFPGTQ